MGHLAFPSDSNMNKAIAIIEAYMGPQKLASILFVKQGGTCTNTASLLL